MNFYEHHWAVIRQLRDQCRSLKSSILENRKQGLDETKLFAELVKTRRTLTLAIRHARIMAVPLDFD
jgi:hypothetical protein